MSIKKLYSNELLASFEYSNIDKDYDFYYVTTSDKYIKGGATFLDIDDIKISALQFESGKSFWVMLPKNAISRAEFVRLLNAKEDGDSLSIKSMTKDTNMYSMPDYTAMGDVLKNVASEGRFPGKDVVTWLRLVMDTTDKIKVHAELDIVIPHIDVNAEYTKANVMGLFKGITTKKEVVRYVFENTGIMLYAYLRGEEERREYLSGNIDINYFDYDDTHAKYSVGEIGNGMKYTIERASVVREIQAVEGSKLIFKKVLPLMGVEFVRYGMLTVVPFPFKYLREYIVKEEKSV